jgi:RNA polymerase II subunit A C-terminal domain phosphatase SSU72
MSSKYKYAVICASNQNRSMEAHSILARRNFNVHSYGTGSQVRLPGPTPSHPNIYPFGTPYTQIYTELQAKDPELYTSNGLLAMLDRNRQIKKAPARFQADTERQYDIIITCEARCFDAVVEELLVRGGKYGKSVWVINVDVRDNHEDAAVGARWILALCQGIEGCKDLGELEAVIEEYEGKYPDTPLLYALCYY